MLHACVQTFDVMGTVEIFWERVKTQAIDAQQGLTDPKINL